MWLEQADPQIASQRSLEALAQYQYAWHRDRWPHDPPLIIETLITQLQQIESSLKTFYWNFWQNEQIIAHASLRLPLLENTDLAWLSLSVATSYRRQGLGKQLLSHVMQALEEYGRTRLITTTERHPASDAFAQSLGATVVIERHTSQLDLAELDSSLLQKWITRAQTSPYQLWYNVGPYPLARLADIAGVFNMMNTQPRGTLNIDWNITPDTLQERDRELTLSGKQRTAAFVENKTGQLVGYTELFWHPGRASLVYQGITVVHPEHRRHGLGRWLKAANLLHTLVLNPEARFILTGNADDNAAMLAINRLLGFKPLIDEVSWQITLEQLKTYYGI